MSDISYRLYELLAAQNEPREYSQWHASDLAQCPRAQFFTRKGIPPINKPSGAKILRWQAGHLIEAAIRPYLKLLYPQLVSNVRYTSSTLDLTGEIDNYDPETKQLIEIKSVGPRAVRYKRVGEDRFHLRDSQPYLHHEWQQHAYVLLLEENEQAVEQITYLYITLEGLLVPYTTPVDPDILQAVEQRLVALERLWRAGELPACICLDQTHPMYGGQLQFCPYREADGRCCVVK